MKVLVNQGLSFFCTQTVPKPVPKPAFWGSQFAPIFSINRLVHLTIFSSLESFEERLHAVCAVLTHAFCHMSVPVEGERG